jgi:HK97 family phage major capsid protein
LLGYPVAIVEAMPDPLGGQFCVGFGDFKRAYMLVDRSEIRVTLDPYTTPGYTKFYVRKRVGGIPADNNAAKFLKLL